MNGKDKARYREELNAVFKYLRANQKQLQEAGTGFYMIYHGKGGMMALGTGDEVTYQAMLITHAASAYYDLYREEGYTLEQYFDELKSNVEKLIPVMDDIRHHAGEEE